MFSLVFGYPSWTRGTYTEHFQKEVHKECLVWSLTSLVGNIGGYMGLCVGFSFYNISSRIVGWLGLGIKIVTKKRQQKHRTSDLIEVQPNMEESDETKIKAQMNNLQTKLKEEILAEVKFMLEKIHAKFQDKKN